MEGQTIMKTEDELSEGDARFYARSLERAVHWLEGFGAAGRSESPNFPSVYPLSQAQRYFERMAAEKNGEPLTREQIVNKMADTIYNRPSPIMATLVLKKGAVAEVPVEPGPYKSRLTTAGRARLSAAAKARWAAKRAAKKPPTKKPKGKRNG